MKKVLLFLFAAASVSAAAQTLPKEHSLKEIADRHRYDVNVTDSSHYFVTFVLNLTEKDNYPLVVTKRIDETNIRKEEYQIGYDTKMNLFVDGRLHKIQIYVENGKVYIYRYNVVKPEQLKEREKQFKKGLIAKDNYPGEADYEGGAFTDRFLVKKLYFDVFYQRWREDEKYFKRKQSESMVVDQDFYVANGKNIPEVLSQYNKGNYWHNYKIATNGKDFAVAFTTEERRPMIELNFAEGGKVRGKNYELRPKAKFTDSFRTAQNDEYQIVVEDGTFEICYFEHIAGTSVRGPLKHRIQWSVNYETNEWRQVHNQEYQTPQQ